MGVCKLDSVGPCGLPWDLPAQIDFFCIYIYVFVGVQIPKS